MRVLIVDDSEDLRELVGLVLRRKAPSWTVAGTAPDGRQAIEVAREIHPDLVLLDASMPVMDGLEALPLIRQSAPGAVVIMLSAFPEEQLAAAAIEAGALGYIDKAGLTKGLVPAVERILREGRVPFVPAQRNGE